MSRQRDGMLKQLLDNVDAMDRRANRRPEVEGGPSGLRRGVILEVTGSVYTVVVYNAAGNTSQIFGNVPYWGNGTLEIEDRVWVVFEGRRPVPIIMGSAGDGSGGAPIGGIALLTSELFPGFRA